jgi:hypothetical protein
MTVGFWFYRFDSRRVPASKEDDKVAQEPSEWGLVPPNPLAFPAIHYLTLFIHLRIGPVTLLSAVSGDITSEMWLWSLYTT